jgi:hypothetical protein
MAISLPLQSVCANVNGNIGNDGASGDSMPDGGGSAQV